MSDKSFGKIVFSILLIIFFVNNKIALSSENLWHNKQRTIRYLPEGEDFIIKNGDKRFNRALYGTNTAFRVEAGDLPEFALFLPNMGGNLKFGLIKENKSKWLINANEIIARYCPGSMLYKINDEFLGDDPLNINVIPFADAEGVIIKIDYNGNENVKLLWVFGGASGTRFHRNGDIGADPESVFYLKPEYCKNDTFEVFNNEFALRYYDVRSKSQKILKGMFPEGSIANIGDASNQEDPIVLINSNLKKAPVLTTIIELSADKNSKYFCVYKPETIHDINYKETPSLFAEAEKKRKNLVNRVKLITPDPYINTLGGALVMAADGVWDGEAFMHGAVAWRMPLNGWRGASMADPLGWSGRAKTHFRGYVVAQYTEPDSGKNIPDPKKGLARQKEEKGVSIFTNGYISRKPGQQSKPHHYDMNLVFIDQIIRHLDWTGDTTFLREIWPVIKRHLAWEKRCFDGNNDGLYDAYCCIWSSDALQYSGGGVTHSSAYNYFASLKAAQLAEILGEDAQLYLNEANKIKEALNKNLWLPELGRYGEYKDLLGNQLVHPSAGVWTYYHTIDSKVPDHFQAYQMIKNIDINIPRIPVVADGLIDNSLYTISTTNWMPYTWSVNNVALAEVMHTALSYWQAGLSESANILWKSALIESMYLGSSPGNIQQLSFYDAFRGELYRDFADPIAMVTRSLVEGLFGIQPDALNNRLIVKPGIPMDWDSAFLKLPEISINFKSTAISDRYTIKQSLPKLLSLELQIKAKSTKIKEIYVNGVRVDWQNINSSIDHPSIKINCGFANEYYIEIIWDKSKPEQLIFPHKVVIGQEIEINSNKANLLDVYDPQKVCKSTLIKSDRFKATISNITGEHVFFIKLKQGELQWWEPICMEITEPFSIEWSDKDKYEINLINNTKNKQKVKIDFNHNNMSELSYIMIPSNEKFNMIIPKEYVICGTNLIRISNDDFKVEYKLISWEKTNNPKIEYQTLDISKEFNDNINNIFQNEYLSPRSPYPTLQLPINGIGNWCYTNIHPDINDSGLRKLGGSEGVFTIQQGIPFSTINGNNTDNIVYTSLWDNYPDEVSIDLSDKAQHIYLLMAGSTNPMQSRFVNGVIEIVYEDGSKDKLELINPETWWPIEQDYFHDGYAFNIGVPKPIRVHLKTGLITNNFNDYSTIKGFSNMAIDGGAATIFDFPLNPDKTLKELILKTVANDVVIGLIAATLVR